jgi:hypothetical protein
MQYKFDAAIVSRYTNGGLGIGLALDWILGAFENTFVKG